MFAFLAVLALGEGSAAPAIRYTVTDRVTADDGVHDQLKNALSQLGYVLLSILLFSTCSPSAAC